MRRMRRKRRWVIKEHKALPLITAIKTKINTV
jgi:hypothetical protein